MPKYLSSICSIEEELQETDKKCWATYILHSMRNFLTRKVDHWQKLIFYRKERRTKRKSQCSRKLTLPFIGQKFLASYYIMPLINVVYCSFSHDSSRESSSAHLPYIVPKSSVKLIRRLVYPGAQFFICPLSWNKFDWNTTARLDL